MAVKISRGRYCVEFMQGGTRVFRRLPPSVTKWQAQELETKLRRELFEAGPLGKRPDLTLPAAIGLWLEHNRRKNQRKAESEARQWEEWVKGKLLKDAPEVAQAAVKAWTASSAARRFPAKDSRIGATTDKLDQDFVLAATCEQRASRTIYAGDTFGRSTRGHATAATINRRLCVLKAAAKLAWKMGLIQENVSGRISLLPERNQREVYLTKGQITRLATCASDAQVKSAIFIAAYTGLRASELLALKPPDSRTHTLSVGQSKSGKPRVVPVANSARPYLSALPLGLSYWQLHKEFDRAKIKAGLPHIRFHDLRHTAASWLINEGVDLYTVGRILGHSTPATTARYAHLSDKTLRKAMAKLK